MITILICIVAVFLFFMFYKPTSNDKVKQEILQQDKISELIEENVTVKNKEYINKDFTNAIVLDEVNQKIHFLSTIDNHCKTYNFNDLIETELIIDNDSITKFNRGNQMVGAVIGGVLAGTPGMIIGGLSSYKITSERIKNMSIKLTFNDMNNPIYKFNFLNSPSGVFKDSHEYKVAMNFIERWYGYFTVILKQHDKLISK